MSAKPKTLNRVKTLAEVMEEDYFSKGLAVCEARILSDSIYFKFRNEEYDLPSTVAWNLIKWDHSRLNSASIRKVRALARKQHGIRRYA